MPKRSDIDSAMKELEKIMKELDVKENHKSRDIDEVGKETIKKDLSKAREIKKSLDTLEKEIFIKVESPDKIVKELLESKKIVKDITSSLMVLIKLSKLREEVIERLERDIESLKEITRELEKELNLEEYAKEFGGDLSKVDESVLSQYIDAIEEDIEEIRRYMGVAR